MTEIKFNPEQQRAVDFYKGAIGVISSAGSGKSSMLVGRVENLVKHHKVPEHEVLAITFTKNSSEDLKKKLAKTGCENVNVGTFHAICAKILYQEGVQITGYNLIKDWQIDNCFKNIDKKADMKEIMSFISYQKNYMRSYNDEFIKKHSEYTEDQLREYFKAYEDMKKQKGLYDFDDFLLICLNLLRESPGKYTYDFVLVDEHQDSNMVQNLLLKEWCQSGNIFAASDYRQCIYRWRAGNPEYSMEFEKYWDNAVMHNVFTNYRSANNIVEQSNHFIKQYYGDYKHYMDAVANIKEDGHISVHSHITRDTEATQVVNKIEQLLSSREEPNEIAVLYRLNKHADFIEAELKRREIEYDIANNSSFFKRNEIAGLIAYLRLAQNIEDDNAFEKIFKLRNMPLKFFSNKIFSDIQNHADRHGLSMYDAFTTMSFDKPWQHKNMIIFKRNMNKLRDWVDEGTDVIKLINSIIRIFQMNTYIEEKYSNQDEINERKESMDVLKSFVKGNNLEQFITYVYSTTDKKKKKKNAVQLMTIHRSKGLEFNNVFLVGVEDKQFPSERSENLKEEANLFYVATTRPKWNLFIHEIGTGNKFIREYGVKSIPESAMGEVSPDNILDIKAEDEEWIEF